MRRFHTIVALAVVVVVFVVIDVVNDEAKLLTSLQPLLSF